MEKARFGTASALVVKEYPLDLQSLTGSYFEQLECAVEEFCCTENELLDTINDVFERAYHDVFDEDRVGVFPGDLRRRR